ncbi:hypothetical protein [Nocardia sp. NPDC051463]|uniref:hypothetical protein n=1 Tax=Nocardia sp. NPDC051463 TaxID=3154845 RepID=UPI003427B000
MRNRLDRIAQPPDPDEFDQLDRPGVVFRGPITDRRAAIAAGLDGWEVVARLEELDGPVERWIAVLSQQSDLHSRKIELAVAWARDHGSEIVERIVRNREAAEELQRGIRASSPSQGVGSRPV